MRIRRHLTGAWLLAATLALTGCGTGSEQEPEPAATTPAAPPSPSAEPSSTETAAGPAVSAAMCEQVHTAVQETKSLNPEPAALDLRPDEVSGDEVLGDVEALAQELQEYRSALEESDGAAPPRPEITVSEGLVSGCADVGVDLEDIPRPDASVVEICTEIDQIKLYQDPKDWDLEEIVMYFLDRAETFAPPEIAGGVEAYRERMLPLGEDKGEESAESREARLTLSTMCKEQGITLMEP